MFHTAPRRALSVTLVGMPLVMGVALPALATLEIGTRDCGSASHVYTRGYWKYGYHSYLDKVNPDGVKDKQVTASSQTSTWKITYLNTWSAGSVNTSINHAYYYMWGQELSTGSSWPGCEAN